MYPVCAIPNGPVACVQRNGKRCSDVARMVESFPCDRDSFPSCSRTKTSSSLSDSFAFFGGGICYVRVYSVFILVNRAAPSRSVKPCSLHRDIHERYTSDTCEIRTHAGKSPFGFPGVSSNLTGVASVTFMDILMENKVFPTGFE